MQQQSWTIQQCKTFQHWLALIGFAVVIALSFRSSDTLSVLLSYGAFFLVTAWPMLKNMIIITVLIGVLVSIFPFLAPFALLLMAFFFLKRLQFVITHWRPVLGGLLIYGSAFIFVDHRIKYGLYRLLPNLNWQHIDMLVFGQVNHYTVSIAIGLLGAVCIHLILVWLYGRGYSVKSALGIMGGVPLVIAAFLLPFLKLHTGLDTIFDGAEPGHGHAMPDGYAVKAPPGYHTVKTYVRTAPDGIESNNLSAHHGDGSVQPAELHVVRGHVRSNPDGILENNLSYQGKAVHGEPDPVSVQPHPKSSPLTVYDYPQSREKNEGLSQTQSGSRLSGKKKLLIGFCGALLIGFAVGKYLEHDRQQPVNRLQAAGSSSNVATPSQKSISALPSAAKTQPAVKVEPLTQKDTILANVRLGTSFSEAKRILGTPLKSEKGNDGLIYTFPNGIEVTVAAKEGIVRGITVDAASISTSRGIRVGASTELITKAYGEAAVTPFDKYNLYEYRYQGSPASILRFAVNKSSGKTDYIGIRLDQ